MSEEHSAITRRRFLATSASATIAVGLSTEHAKGRSMVTSTTISSIELFPVRYPVVGYFKFFEGPGGNYGRAAIFVKMTAENGTVGWGQSVPVARWSYETLDTSMIVLRDYLAPTLIGRDPTDIKGALEAMDKGLAPSFTTGMPIARAGLDLALHDLAGRLTGQSLAEMWGRPQGEPLTLSWTINARTLDEVDSLIETGQKRGYRHFNIKVAPDPKFDVDLAARVRELAPDGFLWADANGGYDPATALAAAPKLADVGVDVLEAPVRPNRLSAFQALKRQGALPILMDEGVVSPVELKEFIRLNMLDGVAMKPSRCGGLVSARRQIELLEEAGLMWLGSGLCDPDVSLAAHVALYATYGLKKPAALNGPQFLTANAARDGWTAIDARLDVPAGPGLGIDVDESKIRHLAKATNRIRSSSR